MYNKKIIKLPMLSIHDGKIIYVNTKQYLRIIKRRITKLNKNQIKLR